MRNAALLIPLIFLIHGTSAAHQPCATTKSSSNTPRCVSKTDMAIHHLADNVGALQQSVPGLTTAITTLASATENASKALANPPPLPAAPPKTFTHGDWLTLMAIIIALSAYMATLRWILIDRLGRAKLRLCYLREQADEPKRNKRIENILDEMQKHQRRIRAISWVDFTLAFPLLAIVYMLFSPYLCEPAWSAPFIAALFFVLAIFLLILKHVNEWLKTLQAWANREVVCKK